MSSKRHDTGIKITTPSPYGSHASMVVDHNEYGVNLADDQVLLKCDTHYYVTKKNRLDNGSADPERYAGKKLYFNTIKQ